MDRCGAVNGLMISCFCLNRKSTLLRLHSLKCPCLLAVTVHSPWYKRKAGNNQWELVMINVDWLLVITNVNW